MSLSPQWLDELRARITLSSVISRTTRLTKAGHEFKACCPFHNEKSPSFTVNDAKGFYHCFGCGAHGDAIRWMTDQRGLSFMDAVKELASEAGLEVPAPDPRTAAKAEQQSGLHDVMATAQAWFVERLASSEGEKARAYLATRGFSQRTIERFGFGFAPEGRQSLKAALSKFAEPMLIEAGLRIAVDDKEPYDRFRGRLMLPIEDARGRVIAFGGRILDAAKTDAPKYLNSPDTPLFDKGRTLYNLHRAGPASRKTGRIVVVEGYMDVVALASADIEDVVAPLGTALTEQQLEMLWRLSENPVLCFDGDAAGQRAAMRAVVRALPHLKAGKSLKIVCLPTGKDPDDVVKASGRQGMEILLDEAFELLDFIWLHEFSASPLETPEQKAGLKERILDHIETIGDKDVKSLYRSAVFERFSKFAYKKYKASSTKKQVDNFDPASRNHLKGIYRLPPNQFLDYMHRRLGAAIARAFLLHPDQIAKYSHELDLVEELDPRLNVILDEAAGRAALDRGALILAIHDRGLEQPHPKDFGFLNLPFAMEFATPKRARETLEVAIVLYARMREARKQLELAQARYERDLDPASEAEKNRILSLVMQMREKARSFEEAFASDDALENA